MAEVEKQQQIVGVHSFHKQHAEHKKTLLSVLKAATQKPDNLFDVLMGVVKVTSLGNIRHSLYQVSGEYRCNV